MYARKTIGIGKDKKIRKLKNIMMSNYFVLPVKISEQNFYNVTELKKIR